MRSSFITCMNWENNCYQFADWQIWKCEKMALYNIQQWRYLRETSEHELNLSSPQFGLEIITGTCSCMCTYRYVDGWTRCRHAWVRKIPRHFHSECWMTFCTIGFPQMNWRFHFCRPELVWFVEDWLEFSQHFFQSLGKKWFSFIGWNVERIGIGKACFLFYWSVLTHSSHCEKFIGFFFKFIRPRWQMIKGLESMTYEERLRELNVYSLKKHK